MHMYIFIYICIYVYASNHKDVYIQISRQFAGRESKIRTQPDQASNTNKMGAVCARLQPPGAEICREAGQKGPA